MSRVLSAPPLGLVPADDKVVALIVSSLGAAQRLVFTSPVRRISVICSTDNGKAHISVSSPDRDPTWHEILTVWRWYAGPDREGVIVVPREREHVNLNTHCFHVWESACGREGTDT